MIQTEIEDLIRPSIEDMGYELWGCEYLAQGKHSLLRIYIDKIDGVGIEDCERVSHQVSSILDVEDPIPGNYSLEVSSPGVPRPLFRDEQFKRYIGHSVEIKLQKPIMGKRKFVGVILSADESTLVLSVDHEQQEFLFSNIVKAKNVSEITPVTGAQN
jgi:ribosome maturation factor RimP